VRNRNNGGSYGKRILVLDNDIDILEALTRILKKNGYYVKGLTQTDEALVRLREEQFDMLIVNYMIEPLNGIGVVKKVREFDGELYVLLLTGKNDILPPLNVLKMLEIQAYCEKSGNFDQLLLLVEAGIKSVAQKRMLCEYNKGLTKLAQSIPEIYQIKPVDELLVKMLEELKPFIKSHNAFILVDDFRESEEKPQNSIYCGIGKYNMGMEKFLGELNSEFIAAIGNSRLSNQTVKLKKGVIIPLINEYNNSIGVIFIEDSDYQENLNMLEIYSKQASISLNYAFLHSVVKTKKEELSRTYDEIKNRYIDTIEVLRLAVDAKDSYTKGHSDRVAFYAEEIGLSLGLAKNELEKLRLGGIFHDIGKIGTADEILLKTTSLDDNEYCQVKKHPVEGANILSAVSVFKDVVPLVKYHHERVDGKGYPEGLKGEEIPFLARVLSVADAFDAMTSNRLYRSKMSFNEAKCQLVEGSGSQFDELVVRTFLKVLE
jgi:putative nucleotidyltransferase with HDIG domain